MKRVLRTTPLPYRITRDERRDSVRLGKYIYLAVIAGIALFVLHRIFGHWYLLEGDGFVHARPHTIAVEFDATIRELHVANGDVVRAGDRLLRYSSVWFDARAVKMATEISQFQRDLSEARIEAARLDAAIASSLQEVQFSRDISDRSQGLYGRGLIPNKKLSDLVHRHYNAERVMLEMKAERDQLVEEIRLAADGLARSKAHYEDFVAGFNDGWFRAPNEGVVANLSVGEGAVVTGGQRILQVFGGDRYILAYLDGRTFVDYAPGSPVIVDMPGGGTVIGRVRNLTAVADRLPEEFQPRFRPATRQLLVLIDLDNGRLDELSILSTVRLFKPLGLQTFLDLWEQLAGGESSQAETAQLEPPAG